MKNDDYYFNMALSLIENGMTYKGTDPFELTELLKAIDQEKEYKDALSDQKLNFNDEISEIVEVGELETTDISVTGDNLYYCNGILTKNSFGLAATVDMLLGIVRTEELDELNQIMFKQLKNRYNDLSYFRRFVVGVDRSMMRLYNVENEAQEDIIDERPAFDKSRFGEEDQERTSRKSKLKNLIT